MKCLIFLCLAASLMVGNAAPPAHASPSEGLAQQAHGAPTAPSANLRYTLGPSDVLEITLYERPELSREVTLSRAALFVSR